MAISGDTLAIGSGENFSIIDISEPKTPQIIKAYKVESEIRQLRLENDLLYVLLHTSIKVFDISDPLKAYIRSTLNLHSGSGNPIIHDFDVKDGMVYAVDGYDMGLQVMDLL